MHDRYRALRVIAVLLRVCAWVVAVFGGLVVVAAAINTGFAVGDPLRGLSVVVGGLVVVALQAVVLFAASALVVLLIDIEQNTRATAEILAGNLAGDTREW